MEKETTQQEDSGVKPQKTAEEIAKHNAIIQKMTKTRIKVFLITSGITILSVILFGIIGWVLDMYLNTKPKILIALVIASFIPTQIVIASIVKKVTLKSHGRI